MIEEGADRHVATEREQASIVASSHNAILGMTAAGTITSCNAAAVGLYGYSPEELVGSAAEMLVPLGFRAREAAALERIAGGGEVEPYRADRLRKDGTVVTVAMSLSPILDADGRVVGAASAARRAGDARDQLQVRVSNQRANVRAANDRFQAARQADRARERLQVEKSQRRFEAEMDVERAKERVHVQDAEDRFQLRMESERAKERLQVQDAEDRFQSELDVERSEAQDDRARLETQLQQGQRLEILGQLAGGVAHDFNNLLAVIINYAAFVTDELGAGSGADVAAAARDVAQIQRAAERAAALTHQLLAFARREVVRPRVLDLNEVVVDVEELLRRTIGEDVQLSTELAADLRPVLMDPGQVEQVLMNVAVNARDAMTGGGTLSIETANVDIDLEPPAGRHVRLRIRDTGRGMSAGVLDRVFEPFYTTKAEGMGTGLGLATVYGIVTQAGGSITVRSRVGVGTTLTILIPATEEVAVPVEEVPAAEYPSSGETVLVVEDEDALRAVTERILTGHGYRVLAAADGVEAVALAGSHDGEISLLITDVVMPKMIGNEVADRIRAVRPGIEVLFMSGYAQHDLAYRSSLDGDVHLIEKPFTAEALLQRAGGILDRDRTTPAAGPAVGTAVGTPAVAPGPNRDRE